MKFAAIVSALFVSMITFSANASIQSPGSFAPTICGTQSQKAGMYFIDIDQVCVGQAITYAYAKVEAVEFRMTTGQAQLFLVSDMQEVGTNQYVATLQNQDGVELNVNMSRDSNGVLESISGKLDVISFKVDKFEEMYNVQ